MSYVTSLANLLQYTAAQNNAQATMMNSAESILGMAGGVTGNETPAELTALNQQELQLSMAKIKAEVARQAYLNMIETAQKLIKEEFDRQRKAIENGHVFG
ncbi:MAG: hypothetical protein AB7P76_08845 [Candidatus Melainabacteria bacterium]